VPSFSDYIVFVDESGDHGMQSIDPGYPVFVLAFCVFHKEAYVTTAAPAVLRFKFKHFGHDQVILHEHEIRKTKGAFTFLFEPVRRGEFFADMNRLVEESPFTVVASVIDKQRLRECYTHPANPYGISVGFGLERIYRHLHGLGCRGGKTHFLFEKRGAKEDAEVELVFRRVCDGDNLVGGHLPFEIVMADKKCNSPGLQLADLIARPIGRHIMNPAQPNRAWDIIQKKVRRSPAGKMEGWGLKVFP
jgi:uncharacterized protein DUF3800